LIYIHVIYTIKQLVSQNKIHYYVYKKFAKLFLTQRIDCKIAPITPSPPAGERRVMGDPNVHPHLNPPPSRGRRLGYGFSWFEGALRAWAID
jgi:hypothetical protein